MDGTFLATSASDATAGMPVMGHFVAIATMLIGVVLLAFGFRVLRAAFVIAAALLGAGAGYVAGVTFAMPAPAWSVGLASAVVLGVLAVIFYRPAMGVAMSLLLAVAFPSGVIAWAQHRGIDVLGDPVQYDESRDTIRNEPNELQRIVDDLRGTYDLLRDADDAVKDLRNLRDRVMNPPPIDAGHQPPDSGGLAPADSGTEPPIFDDGDAQDLRGWTTDDGDDEGDAAWIEQIDQTIERVRTELLARWDEAPPGVRRAVALSAACGAVLGLLLGLSLPGVSASVVTSLGGSGLLVLGIRAELIRFNLADGWWAPQSMTHWIMAWLLLAVIGLAIQWTFRRRPADKNSSDA